MSGYRLQRSLPDLLYLSCEDFKAGFLGVPITDEFSLVHGTAPFYTVEEPTQVLAPQAVTKFRCHLYLGCNNRPRV